MKRYLFFSLGAIPGGILDGWMVKNGKSESFSLLCGVLLGLSVGYGLVSISKRGRHADF